MAQRFSITLTQLTYFTECAKQLNMTVASQELHVAQSAVSTAISHLERSLGTTLFLRQHSKGLVLTEAGETLLRDTQRIFAELSESIESIQAGQNEIRGSVTIACFNTLAPFLLPRLIGRLQEKYPELHVETVEGDYEWILSALRGGRAEIALDYALTEAEGIEHEVVGSVRAHAIVHGDHPLATRGKASIADFAGEPFVLLDLPESRDYFLGLLREAGVDADVKHRSRSYETVRSMVATGLGFSILNQQPLTDATYTGGRVAILELTDPVRSLKIAISSLAQIGRSARARAVAETMREILAE